MESIPYDDIKKCALLSFMAYFSESDYNKNGIIKQNNKKINDIEKILDKNTILEYNTLVHYGDAFICLKDNTCYVVFKGSSSFNHMLRNIDVSLSPIESLASTYVHNGFLKSFKSLGGTTLIDDLVKIAEKCDRIIFTGHSAGGAIASITALFYAMERKFEKQKIHYYVFGSPRIGNSKYTKHFMDLLEKEKCWMVINVYDPVPMFPLSCRYKHLDCIKMFITNKSTFPLVFNKFPIAHIRGVFAFLISSLFKDKTSHDITLYINILQIVSA